MVTYIKGNFTVKNTNGTLCKWQYKIQYYNTSGVNYYTKVGTYHSGCNHSGEYHVNYTPSGPNVLEGRVCAALYSNGNYIDAACEDLY